MLQRLKEAIRNAWQRFRQYWKIYIGWRIRRRWYAFIHGYRFPPLPREDWPDNWFYVVRDEEMDAEEVDATHIFNIKTGHEPIGCIFPPPPPQKVPREKRLPYSEYLRIREEFAKKRQKVEQPISDSEKIETS